MPESKPHSNQIQVLILQHPSEARNALSTAKLVHEALPGSIYKVGLSWRAFKHALGKEADPKEWAVLFVGTRKKSEKWSKMPFAITNSKDLLVKLGTVKGIVLLDGNWAQSKTLWWRNPWLLKLNRMVLNATPNSRYHVLRKEPRKNCLCTAEAAIEVLKHLGDFESSQNVDAAYSDFLERILSENKAVATKPSNVHKIDDNHAETLL